MLCLEGAGGWRMQWGKDGEERKMYLELVLPRLSGWCWVEEIDGENLSCGNVSKRWQRHRLEVQAGGKLGVPF